MSRIPEDVAAEMTPAVRAFVEVLLKRIDDLEVVAAPSSRAAMSTPHQALIQG